MKIIDLICSRGKTGFYFDDQRAIKNGAKSDGFTYRGEAITPGFTNIRQSGESISVMIILEDKQIAYGDCAAVQYSGAGGRDPLFLAKDFIPIIEKEVVPVQKEIQPEEPKKVAVVQPEIKQTPIVEQPIQQEKKVQVVEQPVEEKVTTTIANTSDNDIDETDEDDDLPINIMKDNNTLIISEEDNQIILPYKLAEVQKQFKKNKKKYSSVKDLIENEYILPTDNFKNPVKSRFREAYQLIKKKEHGHLKEAIELGFELMFQSNLNPAVIAACKSLRELDIYLDCLDDNELDKFNCFNIVYNVPPSRKSSSKKRKKE